jgi:hypothetical protein
LGSGTTPDHPSGVWCSRHQSTLHRHQPRPYCLRGEAENRIKETQLDLFGTRASCHKFLANWLRILFSALAYTLMQRLRKIALKHTDLAKATAATIRVRLLKIGAAVIRNTRRIRILLASHHPLRETYFIAAVALARSVVARASSRRRCINV